MIPVYRGRSKQYGYGIGGVLKKITKQTIPLLEPIGKNLINTLKSEGLSEGIGAITDIVSKGLNPKQVIKSRGLNTIKKISRKLLSDIDDSINKSINKPKNRSIKSPKSKKKNHLKNKIRRSKTHKNKVTRNLDIFD